MADPNLLDPQEWRRRVRQSVGLDAQQVAMSLAFGALAAVMNLGVLISLAVLLFTGPLAAFIAQGIGLVMGGAIIMALAMALLSTRSWVLAGPQETPVVVVALITAGVAAALAGATQEVLYATVVAAITLTSLATGVTFLLLGRLQLGSLARYIPYPVVGGFLAGTGWLLVAGGVGIMVSGQPIPPSLPGYLRPPVLWHWLPGAVFGLTIFLILRRTRHPLVLPGLIGAGTALYFGWLAQAGITADQALGRGWLLGPFPGHAVWAPLTPALLAQVNWSAIAGQAVGIATAVLIGVVGLLLNVSGLQIAVREDMNLNRELQATGVAQLIAGLAGGTPGFHELGLSVLGHQMGARSRLVGVGLAAVYALVLVAGTDLLALIPRAVLGGVIIYLGLSFLAEWLYDTWKVLPRLDYVMIVGMLALIVGFGILPGVVAGLALAVVLFVIAYSRIDIVKHTLSGAIARSRRTRSPAEQDHLRAQGEQIALFVLQGYIFFGTAYELYDRVRRALATDLPRLRFVVLDFRLVPRLDSTAMLSFAKLLQLVEAEGLTLVFTQLTPAIEGQITRGLLNGGTNPHVKLFPDQDHGLEWCEDQMLAAANLPDEVGDLRAILARLAPVGSDLDGLLAAFERRMFPPGEYLMHAGDEADTILLLESGQVTARIVSAHGGLVRLESMGPGRMVGELGFFLSSRRTADVVADTAGAAYYITRDGLLRLEQERPAAAAALHHISVRLLSERVVHLIGTVEALQL